MPDSDLIQLIHPDEFMGSEAPDVLSEKLALKTKKHFPDQACGNSQLFDGHPIPF